MSRSSTLSPAELLRIRAPAPWARAAIVLVFLGAAALAGYLDFGVLRDDELTDQRDIYALWQEGGRILNRENPYARTLDGDMRVNQKYATYFPGFYYLSALSQLICPDYPSFIAFWRTAFFPFYVGIAAVLAWPHWRDKRVALGWLVILLWLFNRWALKSVELMHIDFISILLTLGSIQLFPHRRKCSLLLFGLSLAMKQMAVFLVPLYLIWVWNADRGTSGRWKSMAAAAVLIGVIPALLSAPFLVADPKAFAQSILFSATRAHEASRYVGAPSLDEILGLSGMRARAMMLLIMVLVYLTSYRGLAGRGTAAFLVMLVFVDMNTALFRQYFCWPLALLLNALPEISLASTPIRDFRPAAVG